jgi:hypothetical protein
MLERVRRGESTRIQDFLGWIILEKFVVNP